MADTAAVPSNIPTNKSTPAPMNMPAPAPTNLSAPAPTNMSAPAPNQGLPITNLPPSASPTSMPPQSNINPPPSNMPPTQQKITDQQPSNVPTPANIPQNNNATPKGVEPSPQNHSSSQQPALPITQINSTNSPQSTPKTSDLQTKPLNNGIAAENLSNSVSKSPAHKPDVKADQKTKPANNIDPKMSSADPKEAPHSPRPDKSGAASKKTLTIPPKSSTKRDPSKSPQPPSASKTGRSSTTGRPTSAPLGSHPVPPAKKSSGEPSSAHMRGTTSSSAKSTSASKTGPRPPAGSRVVRSTPNSLSEHQTDTQSHRSTASSNYKFRTLSHHPTSTSGKPPWCCSFSTSSNSAPVSFAYVKSLSTPATGHQDPRLSTAMWEGSTAPLTVSTSLDTRSNSQTSPSPNAHVNNDTGLKVTFRSRKPRDFVIHPEWFSEAVSIKSLQLNEREIPFPYGSSPRPKSGHAQFASSDGQESDDKVGELTSPRVVHAAGADLLTTNPVWPRRCRSAPPNKLRHSLSNPISWEEDQ